jgi:hypothetical protein
MVNNFFFFVGLVSIVSLVYFMYPPTVPVATIPILTSERKRKTTGHLTSHPSSDNPCICDYVFDRLEAAGLQPEKMTTIEVQKSLS